MDPVQLIRNAKQMADDAEVGMKDRGTLLAALVVVQLILDEKERLTLEALEGEDPFGELESKIDGLDDKFEDIYGILDDLGDDIESVEQRIETVENRADTIENRLDQQEDEGDDEDDDEDSTADLERL